MATLYFSGIEKAESAQIIKRIPGAAGMISMVQYSPNLLAASEGLSFTMDSGAYTKTLTSQNIEHYAKVIIGLGDRCHWYANADVIGDQEQSNQNYRFLCSLLPQNLQSKVLWVYQARSPMSYLDEALKQQERIGIGGLIPLFQQDEFTASQMLARIAERVAYKEREPHYFGVGQLRWIQRFQAIHGEQFSCDTTTWLVGSKFGRLIREDGRQIPMKGFRLPPDQMNEQNVRVMQSWIEQSKSRVVGVQETLFA